MTRNPNSGKKGIKNESICQSNITNQFKSVFGYGTPTRKNATCLWFLSEASCAGVSPVLSVTIKSSFLPACTNTVHASKLPLIAAQWRGVQPEITERKQGNRYNDWLAQVYFALYLLGNI